MHVPPLRQGSESHELATGISQREAEYPMGHVHQNVGLDVDEDRTLQEPPFWQRGPGPVWQGFMY